jgi:hypothetical protein
MSEEEADQREEEVDQQEANGSESLSGPEENMYAFIDSTTASELDTGIDMLHNRSEPELIGKSLNSFVFVFFKGVIFSFVVI